MGGGHERGVMVWDIHLALAQQRYEAVCDDLARLRALAEPSSRKQRERERDLEAERLRLLAALGRLGPAPRAKMG